MKKNSNFAAKLLLATIVLTAGMGLTAYAGEWQKNSTGWQYHEDNGSYSTNCWQWIDGNGDGVAECYYFDGNGYMLSNTTTPDGYQVDASGAWVVNGVVQTQGVTNGEMGKIDIASYGYTNGVSNIAIEMTTANRADLIAKYGAESIFSDTERGTRVYTYANIPFRMEYDIPTKYAEQMNSIQNGVEVKNLGGRVSIYGSPSHTIEGLTRDNLTLEEMRDYLRQYGYIKTSISLFDNKNHYALDYGNWNYPGYERFKFNIY